MQRKKKLEKANVAIAALVNYFYLLDCVDHALEVGVAIDVLDCLPMSTPRVWRRALNLKQSVGRAQRTV